MQPPEKRRVVITGMGAITPFGPNVAASWKGVVEGRSVVDRITNFDVDGSPTQIASQIQYDHLPFLEEYVDRRTAVRAIKRSARFAHFALIATGEALRDANLLDDERKIKTQYRDDTAIFIGTGSGAIEEIAECSKSLEIKYKHSPEEIINMLSHFVRSVGDMPRDELKAEIIRQLKDQAVDLLRKGKRVSGDALKKFVDHLARNHSYAALKVLNDSGGFRSSIAFEARGGLNCSVNACATGSANIGLAFNQIKLGQAEIVVAGGADASINPVGHWMFALVDATTKRNHDPKHASRPFDLERDGFVMAEGAAVMVLEERRHALKRGAQIFGELIGWAMTSDAKGDTEPSMETQALAIERAIQRSGIKAGRIDYINSHGTSTRIGDKSETAAIKKALGKKAKRTPISSTKSSVGHMIGAAGSYEAICCVKTIREGIIPPTINYAVPDPDCDLDYVPNTARQKKVSIALNDSFGFGGQNCVLVFKRA